MTLSLSNSRQNIPKLGTFGPKFKNFYVFKILPIEEIEDVDFKYDNCFLKKKLMPENTPIKHFWSKITK